MKNKSNAFKRIIQKSNILFSVRSNDGLKVSNTYQPSSQPSRYENEIGHMVLRFGLGFGVIKEKHFKSA